MLTAIDTMDWSEEQQLSAAAALGSFAAELMRMSLQSTRDRNFTDFGRGHRMGLDDGQDMAARWAAIDAARHAHYAEREANRKAGVLCAADLRVVCAWCKCVIREGNVVNGPSHGICPDCEARELQLVEEHAGPIETPAADDFGFGCARGWRLDFQTRKVTEIGTDCACSACRELRELEPIDPRD